MRLNNIKKQLYNKCRFCICCYSCNWMNRAVQQWADEKNIWEKKRSNKRNAIENLSNEIESKSESENIGFRMKIVHIINEFSPLLYPSFALKLCRIYLFRFRFLSPDLTQINQFYHVRQFLWWISFQSHSIFFRWKIKLNFRINTEEK